MSEDTFGPKLGSLRFTDLMGGPLCAMVEARGRSSMATIGFIESLGLERDSPDRSKIVGTRDVTFKYKTWLPPSGSPSQHEPAIGEALGTQLTVPLLTLVHPPSLRIDEIVLDFHVKIPSPQRQVTEHAGVGVDPDAKAGVRPYSAELKANFSYQKRTEEGTGKDSSYTLAVHVEVLPDELPAGLDRVLTMLENSIRPSPGEVKLAPGPLPPDKPSTSTYSRGRRPARSSAPGNLARHRPHSG